MIIPVKEKHTLFQGATWERTYEVRDEQSVLVDITGCTAKLALKNSYNDTVAIIEVDGAVNGSLSQVQFVIPASSAVGMNWDTLLFDGELYWPDGIKIDKLAYGSFKLQREVTTA